MKNYLDQSNTTLGSYLMNLCREETKSKNYSNITNLILDVMLFINLIALLSSGVVLHHSLPHGRHFLTLWGMNRHQWGELHALFGFLFLLISIIHLILHWRWLACMIVGKKKQKIRIVIATIGFLLAIGLSVALFLSPAISN